MKLILKTAIGLIYCTLAVLAKGGGGGRGGGSSGGSSRSGGSSGGSSRSGGSSSGTRTGSTGPGVAGTGSTSKTVSSKGGSGGFGGAPPPYYASTRSTYSNYPPAYSGGYSSASRYGYTGFYNPSLLYFAILPPFLFYGYNSAYHRYNQNNGYYYAPQLTEQGSNTQNAVINGTTNSGKDDNYHYSFNISTNNQYPMVDHAFFSSSDHNARDADFVYRLQFSHVIEFEDANQNGFYDANEPIYSVTSLQNLAWQPFQVTNRTVPNNATQSYLQTGTTANVVYNNTGGNMSADNSNLTIRIIYRTSNLQLNNTAPIIMQPNSLQYDFSVEGFPVTVANAHPNARLGVVQLLSTKAATPVNFDVNITTPLDVANKIKTNLTYGLSIGDYTQGRSEYQPTVNISDASSGMTAAWTTGIDPTALAGAPAYSTDDWIWGSQAPSTRVNKLLLITLPGYATGGNSSATGGVTTNATFSGFGFLDTDVMNALANDGGLSSLGLIRTCKIMNLMLASSIAIYFIVF